MSDEVTTAAEQPATESAPGSAIDALMARFGDEPDTPETEAPETDNAEVEGGDAPEVEPETASDDEGVEVEYEGKTYKLPPELKDAVLRQADYTRKTQEVAEERKALIAERELVTIQSEFQKSHAKDIQDLQAIDSQLERYNQVNWAEAMQQDIAAATTAFMQRQQLMEARQKMADNLRSAETSFQQTVSQKASELRAKGLEELNKRIPGWSDETAAKVAEATQKAYGFTPDEVNMIRDPRAVQALHDAMKYRELIAQKPTLNQKVQTLPKPVKPGSTEARSTDAEIQQRKAMSRLKQTGSSRDAVELLMQRIK